MNHPCRLSVTLFLVCLQKDECHLYVNPTFFRLISPRSVMQNKPTYYMAASQVSFLRK